MRSDRIIHAVDSHTEGMPTRVVTDTPGRPHRGPFRGGQRAGPSWSQRPLLRAEEAPPRDRARNP